MAVARRLKPCRATAEPARQSLPSSCAVPNLIQVSNLIGFKRRATVEFNS